MTNLKQVPSNNGFFINVGSLAATQGAATAGTLLVNGGSDSVPMFSTNIYAVSSSTSTLLAVAGSAILRDMGKTLVSSGRVFRKVQLVQNNSVSTNGVGGTAASGPAQGPSPDYLTGYIELPGMEFQSGTPSFAKVARLG
jgi:hypothetical protein